MRPRAFVLATAFSILLLGLTACGGEGTEGEPGTNPQPSSTLKGDIAVGSESGGTLFLNVSDDGGAVASLTIQLTDLSENRRFAEENPGDLPQCLAAFGDPLLMVGLAFFDIPVSDGRFAVNDTGKLGVLTGRFDTPTTASGTVLLLKDGMECGEWSWTAALQGDNGDASPLTLTAGATGTGTIRGRVIGKDGPVASALVQLSSLSDEACAAASDNGLDLQEGQSDADIELLKTCRDEVERIPTDQDGDFVFSDLPPGLYAMWIHWEQSTAPPVPLREVPPAGFFYATLSAELVGDYRVDVSMHEATLGTYEIDVHLHSFELPTDGASTKNFTW